MNYGRVILILDIPGNLECYVRLNLSVLRSRHFCQIDSGPCHSNTGSGADGLEITNHRCKEEGLSLARVPLNQSRR